MQSKLQAAIINDEKLLVTLCFKLKVKNGWIGIFKVDGKTTETVRSERES